MCVRFAPIQYRTCIVMLASSFRFNSIHSIHQSIVINSTLATSVYAFCVQKRDTQQPLPTFKSPPPFQKGEGLKSERWSSRSQSSAQSYPGFNSFPESLQSVICLMHACPHPLCRTTAAVLPGAPAVWVKSPRRYHSQLPLYPLTAPPLYSQRN